MAITALEYLVFSTLRNHNQLPARPRVLELGESNWYGDVPIEQLEQEVNQHVEQTMRSATLSRLRQVWASDAKNRLYEVARIFYDVFLQPASYTAIDPGTPGSQYRFDLNQPVPLNDKPRRHDQQRHRRARLQRLSVLQNRTISRLKAV